MSQPHPHDPQHNPPTLRSSFLDSSPTTGTSFSQDDLSEPQAKRLLMLALTKRRPVDRLIDRISASDGHGWMRTILSLPAFTRAGDLTQGLVQGGWTADRLGQFKNECKQMTGANQDERSRLAGMLGYYLAVAAGLAHSGRNLSSQPQAELEAVLLDLAEAAPLPWSDLLARGALKLTGE